MYSKPLQSFLQFQCLRFPLCKVTITSNIMTANSENAFEMLERREPLAFAEDLEESCSNDRMRTGVCFDKILSGINQHSALQLSYDYLQCVIIIPHCKYVQQQKSVIFNLENYHMDNILLPKKHWIAVIGVNSFLLHSQQQLVIIGTSGTSGKWMSSFSSQNICSVTLPQNSLGSSTFYKGPWTSKV